MVSRFASSSSQKEQQHSGIVFPSNPMLAESVVGMADVDIGKWLVVVSKIGVVDFSGISSLSPENEALKLEIVTLSKIDFVVSEYVVKKNDENKDVTPIATTTPIIAATTKRLGTIVVAVMCCVFVLVLVINV